jgi:hypothetical protein
LQEIGNDRYRVLLTKVPLKPRTDGEQLRAMLVQNAIAQWITFVARKHWLRS